MKLALRFTAMLLLLSVTALADDPPMQDELLDRFAGTWLLQGTIAGGEVTHDIVAKWVLGHQYLSFHELSRETDTKGRPLYEATVFIGREAPDGRYACLWLDSTGGTGLNMPVTIGHAEPAGDVLAFVFHMPGGGVFHTTFIYKRDADTWDWTMDSERDGELSPFARVTLTRQ